MTLTVDVRQRLGSFELDAGFTSEGGVTALFGRSGSGKTSIMRIIAGLERPDEGRVVLDGDVLVDTGQDIFVPKHRRRFGYVFQETRLFPHLSVRQNLSYGRWFAPSADRAENLHDVTSLLGIKALMDRRPGNLSGGEKQRVAIGRALLSSPRMLLMDEPLAALDEDRKQEILPYLERLRDRMKIPIVYVSHSVSEVARLADRVVVIDDGRVVASGEAADVISHPAISAALAKRETGALLEGTLGRYDAEYRLNHVTLKASSLLVPGSRGDEGRRVRVHIPARDVMLSTSKPTGISALNVLQGTAVAASRDPDGMIDIHVDCGGDIIQSRITRLSWERLRLDVGSQVYAIIKTVALEES
jgi:molybdenum ABC transporter, ATP-binding protein